MVLPADVAAALTAAASHTMPVPRLGPARHAESHGPPSLIARRGHLVLLVGVRGGDPEVTAALHRLIADTDLPVVETFQAAGVISANSRRTTWDGSGCSATNPATRLAHADVSSPSAIDPVEYDPALWNNDADPHGRFTSTRRPRDRQPLPARPGTARRYRRDLGELTPLLSGLRLDAEQQRHRRTARRVGRHR